MSSHNRDDIFSSDDAEILQEVMNIAFGQASADLAEVIDIRVLLNVPFVEMIDAQNLPQRIKDEVKVYDDISIIEQNYWGKFKGTALLIFPTAASKSLISLFEDDQEVEQGKKNVVFEKETLLEVGNILIGACVGKIAELLNDIVSYSPPRVIMNNVANRSMLDTLADQEKLAIFMKTVFHLEDRDVSGFLFLIAAQDSLVWLKTALNNFLERFE